MFKAKQFLQLLICSLFFITSFEAFAQTRGNQTERVRDLITERRSNIPSQAQSRAQYYRAFKEYKKVHVVKLPENLYEEEVLTLYIDSDKRELRFSKNNGTEIQIVKREITVFSDSIYIWKGDIYDPTSDEIMGDAMLVQNHKGEITGTIDVAGLFFQIRSLGASGLSAIIEYDEEEVKKQNESREENGTSLHDGGVGNDSITEAPNYEDCSLDYGQPSLTNFEDKNPITNQILPINPTCPKHFARIIVLYTAGAANYGNINNIIAQAITETNDAYWNSDSNTGAVILQHSQQIGFVETNDIDADLEFLRNNSTIQSLRIQHNADIVIFLTKPGAYNYAGLARSILLEYSKAYAIVDVSSATGSDYTFAHELGHLQGLQHHPNDPTESNYLYSYGFGHRIAYSCSIFPWNCQRSTIMAYRAQYYIPGSRIKYYSNPNKTYNGQALGIVGVSENYKVLNNTRVAIANHRDENEVNAGISYLAGLKTNFGQNFTFSNNSCGGNGSYSFEWRKSLNNPTNFGGVVSTNSNYSPALSPGTWYVQLKVTTGTGQTSTKVISVVAEADDGSGGGGPGGGPIPKLVNDENGDKHNKPESIQLLPAYPNPFNPNTNISFQLPETGQVLVSVFDLNGREVIVLADQVFSAGTHQLMLNASDLSSGTYILRLQTLSNVLTQTLTLIK